MALKAVLANLDGLSAEVAKEYVQRDGKFFLDVTAVDGVELSDVTGLKKALSTERTARETAERSLGSFKDIDPTKAKDALAKVAEMANWNPEKEVAEKIRAREEQLIKKHGETTAQFEARIKRITKQLEGNLVIAAATKALADAQGSVALLLPHVQRFTRMRELEDGRFVVEVLDESGNVRIGDTHGNPMTIPQLVDEMKNNEQYAPAFKGTGSTGSGGNGGGTPPKTPTGGKPIPQGGGKPAITPGSIRISRKDQAAINAHVDQIASGEAVLVD